MKASTKMELREYFAKSMTYAEYIKLIDDLLLEGNTTGPVQSEAMFGYARLNRQRMHRIEKTVSVGVDLAEIVRSAQRPMIWLTLTEGWCGDAAQNIPVIEKIASESNNIETRYLLRDENLELMDAYLTNNARSIPKLIALDAETFEVLGTWGARPAAAQDAYVNWKHEGLEKPAIMEKMQRWYNDDKTLSLQSEFAELVKKWGRR